MEISANLLLSCFHMLCVWYTIPWAANQATICVSCRSVNSLQYNPPSPLPPVPSLVDVVETPIEYRVCLRIFFWLITLISKIQHHQCLLVIWCELIMIMNIKLSPLCGCLKVCLRLPYARPWFTILIQTYFRFPSFCGLLYLRVYIYIHTTFLILMMP